jgi:hypothetical protein
MGGLALVIVPIPISHLIAPVKTRRTAANYLVAIFVSGAHIKLSFFMRPISQTVIRAMGIE